MKDIADDVKEMIISGTGGEYFVISKEEIFQATSKSDNQGIRQITGYDEYRISSYDLNTGKLSARIEIGGRKENECTFLGKTDGKLWYKSVDKNLGVHAREPKNLAVIITQDKITEVNPFLKDNLSQPEWNNIRNYYGFDMRKMMPMISDISGFVYLIDPVSLKAVKTEESIENFKYDNNCLSTSVSLNANNTIYLKGTPRNYLDIYNKEIKDVSFLKGQFIRSSNTLSPAESNQDFYLPFIKEVEKYRREIDSIQLYVNSTDTNSVVPGGKKFYKDNYRYAKRNIGYFEDKIKRAQDNIDRYNRYDNYEIINKGNGLFVLSQTDATDQAKVIITKVKINADSTISQSWQTVLHNIYRDPVKGLDRSAFDVVFSKGDPDLSTMRALSGEGKLVFMLMLRTVCIDIETGSVLWDIELK